MEDQVLPKVLPKLQKNVSITENDKTLLNVLQVNPTMTQKKLVQQLG